MSQKIIGRIAILAAICSPDVLPSAVFIPGTEKSEPFCAHVLRSDDLSFTNKFINQCRTKANLPKDGSRDDEMVAHVWPFYEDFPHQNYTCTGCGVSEKVESGHYIKHNGEACRKTAQACA